MRIGIMGAGAVGCFVGGTLHAHGASVVWVGRERLVNHCAAHGMTVETVAGVRHTIASQHCEIHPSPEILSTCDVVVVSVKTPATFDVAATIAPLLGPDCLIASLQNGVSNPRLLREGMASSKKSSPRLSPPSIAAGIVHFNVVSKENGDFVQTTDGELALERPANLSPHQAERFEKFVSSLCRAGLQTDVFDDLLPQQYSKLVVNLNNAVVSLTGLPTAKVLADADYRRIIAAVVDEALDVLDANRIRPAPFRRVPLRLMPKMFRLPSLLLRPVLRTRLKVAGDARPSMWDDLVKGRPTEVDFLNGEIVRLAAAAKTDAPLNARLVELIHQAETADTPSPCFSPSAFRVALGL